VTIFSEMLMASGIGVLIVLAAIAAFRIAGVPWP